MKYHLRLGNIATPMAIITATVLAACGGSEPNLSVTAAASVLAVDPAVMNVPTASASSMQVGANGAFSEAQASSGNPPQQSTASGSASASAASATAPAAASGLAAAHVYNLSPGHAIRYPGERRDATFEPPAVNFAPSVGTSALRVGQGLTIQRSGWLTRVELYLESCTTVPPALRLDVRRSTAASASVIASGTIETAVLPPGSAQDCAAGTSPGYWASIPLDSTPLRVMAGEILSLWPIADVENTYRWPGGFTADHQIPLSHTADTEQQFLAGYGAAYRTFVVPEMN